MITNTESGTRIDEIAGGIYRISTPVREMLGGFSFNQYLVVDEAPLLFHTGPRRMFPLTREAIGKVMPVERLKYIGLSHFEAERGVQGADGLFRALARHPGNARASRIGGTDHARLHARQRVEG